MKKLLFLGETKGLWQDCLNLNQTLDDQTTIPESQNDITVTNATTTVTDNVTTSTEVTTEATTVVTTEESEGNDTSEGSGIGR